MTKRNTTMTTEEIVKAIEKATNGTFMPVHHSSTLMGGGPDEYDVNVVGTQISDDTMRIYVKAKERRCIDRIKCEFTLENNIINNETRID